VKIDNPSSDTPITPPFVKEVGPGGTATAGIVLESNKLTGSIISYTDTAHFKKTGDWKTDSAVGIVNLFEFKFLTGTVETPSKAIFTLPITEDGNYRISLLYKPGKDRASNVPVSIRHAGGIDTITWDMTRGSRFGFAVPVGTYRFAASDTNTVTLETDGANGKVVADSVAFVKVNEAIGVEAKARPAGKPAKPLELKGLLIDEREAQAEGDWQEGEEDAILLPGYLHDGNKDKGKKSLTFDVTVKKPGKYKVKFLYPKHRNRATNTPVTLIIGEQRKEFRVNQRESDGAGFELGTFAIEKVMQLRVSTTDANGYVVVDGVQLLPD
jgi:hypothetical protein